MYCVLGQSADATPVPICNGYAWSPTTFKCYLYSVNFLSAATVASPATDFQFYTVQCV